MISGCGDGDAGYSPEIDNHSSTGQHKTGFRHSTNSQRIRGWFPRKCAVELVSDEIHYEDCKIKNNKQRRKNNGEGKKNR